MCVGVRGGGREGGGDGVNEKWGIDNNKNSYKQPNKNRCICKCSPVY